MKDQDKTKQQLVCEVDELRGQVAALEKSLQDTQSAAALHRRT
jgi:DNA-binding FrmR family transcriptional regulator